MKPPKCKSCGKEEWRHICGGGKATKEMMAVSVPRPSADKFALAAGIPPLYPEPRARETIVITIKPKRGRPKTSTPEQRKAYLAVKAKERRSRERATKP